MAIAAGELRAGEALTSVRQLAARLRVNPATVVQAYRELEADGLVELRQGAGTFVCDVALERRAGERATQAAALVHRMLADAARLGLSSGDVTAAMRRELDGETA